MEGGASNDDHIEQSPSIFELKMMALRMVVARRAIYETLPLAMMHDPALDILLALYRANSNRLTVEAVGDSSNVAPSIVRRWVAALADYGLVSNSGTHVSLSPMGFKKMATMLTTVIAGQSDIRTLKREAVTTGGAAQ